jgi:hypothetical protein
MLAVGQRNRAMTEMMAIIKAYPSHPASGTWIATLENLLKPDAAAAATTTPAPGI